MTPNRTSVAIKNSPITVDASAKLPLYRAHIDRMHEKEKEANAVIRFALHFPCVFRVSCKIWAMTFTFGIPDNYTNILKNYVISLICSRYL